MTDKAFYERLVRELRRRWKMTKQEYKGLVNWARAIAKLIEHGRNPRR